MLTRVACLSERWRFRCDGSVISVSATPNCSLIAATTVGRSLYLLTSEGQTLWHKTGEHALDHEGWSTSLSSDGSVVAVGTANKKPADGTVYVFDSRGELLFTRTLGAPVWSVSLSKDGGILGATCWNGIAYKFVRNDSGYALVAEFKSDIVSGLYGIKLARDGKSAVVCAYDAALIMLNEQWQETARQPSHFGLYNVALAEDACLAVAGQRDGSFLLFKQGTGESQTIKVSGCDRPICGIAASRHADLFVCGSFDGWVYLTEANGRPLGRIETDGEVWSVACSDDAALICIGSGDHTLRLVSNWCSVAPIREVMSFESSVIRGGSETETHLTQLVRLYAQYGLCEYGYRRLQEFEDSFSAATLFRKASHDLLRETLLVSPTCYWAHYELGLIAQEHTHYQEAVQHFQIAAQHPEYTSKAMTRCADCFASLKFSTATASCYRRAREQNIDTDAKRVLYNLGRSYEDTKQWREAMSHYELLASWDAGYRNTWERLEHLLSIHGSTHPEATPRRSDYTGITISLLGPDAPREVDKRLIGVLQARTSEVLINSGEREGISRIIAMLRNNKAYCRGITGAGLSYTQQLFLKYDYALPEDETKKFLETVNLLYLIGASTPQVTLDIGSATGRYPTLMTWLGAKARGIDIERRAITYAKQLKPSGRWPKYSVADARSLPFKKPSFDLVTCMMGTFAHIPIADQQNVIKQMCSALRPKGHLAISTWDMECGHLAYLSIYNENQKNTIRRNSPSSQIMREMLVKGGFEHIEIRPFCMLPQIIVYDLGLENLRSGDIRLAAQADLAVRSLYPNKHGEMFLAFAQKPN